MTGSVLITEVWYNFRMNYQAKTFTVPALVGISTKSIDEHIGLYQGYVKNFNAITESLQKMRADATADGNAVAELVRRLSFEFDGMRLHELYFPQFEGGASALTSGPLFDALTKEYGSVEAAVAILRKTAQMRGPGWALLYYDPTVGAFHIGFSGEQHLGHFATLPIVLAVDVWEHAYVLDHGAAGKGSYLDAFFNSVNWRVVAERFAAIA